MRHDSDIQIDLQLIGKYLAGEASPEEAFSIDVWRGKAPENNELFEVAARLWDEAPGGEIYRRPHQIDEWLKLKEIIEKERKPFIGRRLYTGWKVAAALIVLMGFAIFFYLMQPHTASVMYSERIDAKTMAVKDTLRDSSVVVLFPQSRLRIQDRFAQTGRKVRLEGQGYFSVKRMSDSPFTIYADSIEIIVLGTVFNVKNDVKKVTVSVESGIVKMKKNAKSIVVTAGSSGVFYKSNDRFVLYRDSLDRNSYGYATRSLYFYSTSLAHVKEALENTYGVRVILENKALDSLRINTQFNDRSLDYVLKVISASLDIQYRRKDDTIYFFKNGL
ncbi:FecR family protein [Compostibacter hankyongensis]|uniref:FecR domain-containing protein n=1 Tax=Compostibacter hankyongensis TaxID=1007089 RepID=A0ABP8FQK9_9BACT